MKPVKLLKPNMKPMKRTPKQSYGTGNVFFWVIVILAVLYILSGWAGHSFINAPLG